MCMCALGDLHVPCKVHGSTRGTWRVPLSTPRDHVEDSPTYERSSRAGARNEIYLTTDDYSRHARGALVKRSRKFNTYDGVRITANSRPRIDRWFVCSLIAYLEKKEGKNVIA